MIHVEEANAVQGALWLKDSKVEVKVTTVLCFPLLSCHVSPERKEDLEASSSFPNWRLISFRISG